MFNGVLYLSVTPRIRAKFDRKNEESIQLLTNMDYRLDQVEMQCRCSSQDSEARVFRQQRVSWTEDASPDPIADSLSTRSPHLQSLPVEHDGDLVPAPEAEDGALDNEPQLELVVPSATPGVLAKDIGIVLLTTHTPIDRDGHSQPALVHIFPPSPYLPISPFGEGVARWRPQNGARKWPNRSLMRHLCDPRSQETSRHTQVPKRRSPCVGAGAGVYRLANGSGGGWR
ncbi:hypothetical protein EYR38_009904 [Pleurotus pulmonarius]|nr:hypothetical protein EYR38_009904 [Pleurotus pulmonarius]